MQQHDLAVVYVIQHDLLGFFGGHLLLVIPIGIGKAPEYSGIAHFLGPHEIFSRKASLGRSVIACHGRARQVTVGLCEGGKLGRKGFGI